MGPINGYEEKFNEWSESLMIRGIYWFCLKLNFKLIKKSEKEQIVKSLMKISSTFMIYQYIDITDRNCLLENDNWNFYLHYMHVCGSHNPLVPFHTARKGYHPLPLKGIPDWYLSGYYWFRDESKPWAWLCWWPSNCAELNTSWNSFWFVMNHDKWNCIYS